MLVFTESGQMPLVAFGKYSSVAGYLEPIVKNEHQKVPGVKTTDI